MKKEILKQQRNHLGGHLKNTMVHLDDINFRILEECKNAWGNRNYSKKDVIRAIRGILGQSKRFAQIPKKEVLQFHPLEKYNDENWWKEKYKTDNRIIDEHSFDTIFPSMKDLDDLLVDKDKILEHTQKTI
tara:strand:- start:7351 stop:7743 length:393 start_codon:yes stop_codon:yes gene_type:complete